MQLTKEIIKEKMEKIDNSLNQYKEGLITGAEALLYILVVVDDPVVSVIHQYDVDCRELAKKTAKNIRELGEIEVEGELNS